MSAVGFSEGRKYGVTNDRKSRPSVVDIPKTQKY